HYKTQLDIPAVRFIGYKKATIKRIAIVGAAGIGYAHIAKNKQAALFITGDVKHHEALDSIMEGINVLDDKHYSEYVVKDGLKSLLEDWSNGEIDFVSSNINTDSYEYM